MIEVAKYTAAFRTWISVARDSVADTDEAMAQRVAIVDAGMRWLAARYRGTVATETLCDALDGWARERDDIALLPRVNKSCLLARLIYGGEELRTRRCPIHDGHWAGVGDACIAGCSYDANITGWLPNGYVDDWPAIDVDPVLAAIEETLSAEYSDELFAVYVDRLQLLNDPRGELIAIHRVETDEGEHRRRELARAWLGPLAEFCFVTDGFVQARLRSTEDVRALFDAPAGRYLRRVTIHAERSEAAAIERFLAARTHRWLVR